MSTLATKKRFSEQAKHETVIVIKNKKRGSNAPLREVRASLYTVSNTFLYKWHIWALGSSQVTSLKVAKKNPPSIQYFSKNIICNDFKKLRDFSQYISWWIYERDHFGLGEGSEWNIRLYLLVLHNQHSLIIATNLHEWDVSLWRSPGSKWEQFITFDEMLFGKHGLS